MSKTGNIKTIVATFLVATICSQCTEITQPIDSGYLSVEDTRFIDGYGRTVQLNGLNHVNKNPDQNYLDANDEALFKQFKAWGLNFIRYGIHWDALEPEPGKMNEAYLKEIDKRVQWAAENGIWLMLDMHQDLYGRKFGNGAPDWATLDEGVVHTTGNVWSDAYMLSGAVQKSFDNFWANKPATDSIGIQDHYLNLWKLIAQRYADSPSVAGFDLMNEPFMGTAGTVVFPKLMEGYAAVMMQQSGKTLTESEMATMWSDESMRIKTLNALNDKDTYHAMLTPAIEVVNEFEQGTLSDFYQKARDVIRSVNKKQILFLEHNFFCNMGIPSNFRIPTDENGQTDKLCAYAPHGYDLVTDTDGSDTPGNNRVDYLFGKIFQTGVEKKLPVVVGEWGAYYMGSNKYMTPARQIIELYEKNLAGQTYWSYWENIEKQDYFLGVLVRPYPMAVNGVLYNYKNDFDSKTFECSWTEEPDNKTYTQIFIPDMTSLDKQNVKLEPESDFTLVPIENQPSGYMLIAPTGKQRKLSVLF